MDYLASFIQAPQHPDALPRLHPTNPIGSQAATQPDKTKPIRPAYRNLQRLRTGTANSLSPTNKLGHPPIKSKTGHHNLSHVIFFFPFSANPLKFSPVTTGLPDRFSIRGMNPTATINSPHGAFRWCSRRLHYPLYYPYQEVITLSFPTVPPGLALDTQ